MDDPEALAVALGFATLAGLNLYLVAATHARSLSDSARPASSTLDSHHHGCLHQIDGFAAEMCDDL
jgi:hypothetical protein